MPVRHTTLRNTVLQAGAGRAFNVDDQGLLSPEPTAEECARFATMKRYIVEPGSGEEAPPESGEDALTEALAAEPAPEAAPEPEAEPEPAPEPEVAEPEVAEPEVRRGRRRR